MSLAGPWGRATPRWSVGGKGEPPASIAGLPLKRRWVSVGPPLYSSRPRRGSALTSLGRLKPQLRPFSRLWPWERSGDEQLSGVASPFARLRATRVFLKLSSPLPQVSTPAPPPS